MRQHRYSPLIGTVFSQRQQEKNIFRVDITSLSNTFQKREYYIEGGKHDKTKESK